MNRKRRPSLLTSGYPYGAPNYLQAIGSTEDVDGSVTTFAVVGAQPAPIVIPIMGGSTAELEPSAPRVVTRLTRADNGTTFADFYTPDPWDKGLRRGFLAAFGYLPPVAGVVCARVLNALRVTLPMSELTNF